MFLLVRTFNIKLKFLTYKLISRVSETSQNGTIFDSAETHI